MTALPDSWSQALRRVASARVSRIYMPAALLVALDMLDAGCSDDGAILFEHFEERFRTLIREVRPAGVSKAWQPFYHLSGSSRVWQLGLGDQAAAFDEMVAPYGGVSIVPMIHIEDDEAMRRITGRRVCRSCGAVYHVDFNPPKQEEVCDLDGGELYQRDDDKPDTVRNRLYVYYKQTSPLIGYYFAKQLLATIDGNQPIGDVYAALEPLLVD